MNPSSPSTLRPAAIAKLLVYLRANYRRNGRVDSADVATALVEAGYTFDTPLIKEILGESLYSLVGDTFLLPEAVLKCLLNILADRKFDNALDPWAGIGLLLATVVEAGVAKSGTGILTNDSDLVMARAISGDLNINWVQAERRAWLSECKKTFDLIVGCFPFGIRPQEVFVTRGEGLIALKDEPGRLIMANSASRLTEDGIGVFIVPNFDSRRAEKSVFRNLERLGLAMDAFFALFPLGSILWTYNTAGDDSKRRYECLLHFFEALAEFMATILLSAVAADSQLFSAERVKLQKTLAEQKLDVSRGTFGTWKCIFEQLAKTFRKLTATTDGQNRLTELLRTHDLDVVEMLTKTELVAVIQYTNGLRNTWVGHAGAVGEREAAQRHLLLSGELAKVRDAFGTSWDRYCLVLPGKSIFSHGLYRYTLQKVLGRCAPFEHFETELSSPLEHGNLHFLGSDERVALRLIPFVRVMPSPSTAENACYFYNREQADGVRFVSYHFEQEADVVNHFPDTSAILRQLVAGDDSAPAIGVSDAD